MENIRNLELARLHKEVQAANTLLKTCLITDEESVIVYGNIQEAMGVLDSIETRLHNLAYGDCQFLHRLPYPVKPSVKRGRLIIYPKAIEEDIA